MRPTPTGLVALVLLVVFMVAGPAVADPDMAGFVWAAVLGFLVVGVAWPCAVVRVVAVDAVPGTSAHGDAWDRPARVGAQVLVPVRVGGRLSDVSLCWDGDVGAVPVAPGATEDVDLPVTSVRRGRFQVLRAVISCDAPFGLVVASRSVDVGLPRPLVVGPAEDRSVDPPEPDAGRHVETAVTAVGHGGDTIRSVRPYITGDPAHLVHWPTSARVGSLVVRELEPPVDRAVAVVVDLGDDPGDSDAGRGTGRRPSDRGRPRGRPPSPPMPSTPLRPDEVAAEEAVTRAAGAVATLRGRGVRVLLCTAEPAGVSAEVGDDDTALRRLASATCGTPGAVPPGWSILRFRADRDDG